MNFTGFFIKRTVFTSLMAFSIFLAGIITFHLIPVSALPKLVFPAIHVKVGLPVATPEVVGGVVFGRFGGAGSVAAAARGEARTLNNLFRTTPRRHNGLTFRVINRCVVVALCETNPSPT